MSVNNNLAVSEEGQNVPLAGEDSAQDLSGRMGTARGVLPHVPSTSPSSLASAAGARLSSSPVSHGQPLSERQYIKEDLLALYAPTPTAPAALLRVPLFTTDTSLTPVAHSPISPEEEQLRLSPVTLQQHSKPSREAPVPDDRGGRARAADLRRGTDESLGKRDPRAIRDDPRGLAGRGRTRRDEVPPWSTASEGRMGRGLPLQERDSGRFLDDREADRWASLRRADPLPRQGPPGLAAPPRRRMEWFYRDLQGTVQGPFQGHQMQEWNEAGYFSCELPLRCGTTDPFLPLKLMFPGVTPDFTKPPPDRDALSRPMMASVGGDTAPRRGKSSDTVEARERPKRDVETEAGIKETGSPPQNREEVGDGILPQPSQPAATMGAEEAAPRHEDEEKPEVKGPSTPRAIPFLPVSAAQNITQGEAELSSVSRSPPSGGERKGLLERPPIRPIPLEHVISPPGSPRGAGSPRFGLNVERRSPRSPSMSPRGPALSPRGGGLLMSPRRDEPPLAHVNGAPPREDSPSILRSPLNPAFSMLEGGGVRADSPHRIASRTPGSSAPALCAAPASSSSTATTSTTPPQPLPQQPIVPQIPPPIPLTTTSSHTDPGAGLPSQTPPTKPSWPVHTELPTPPLVTPLPSVDTPNLPPQLPPHLHHMFAQGLAAHARGTAVPAQPPLWTAQHTTPPPPQPSSQPQPQPQPPQPPFAHGMAPSWTQPYPAVVGGHPVFQPSDGGGGIAPPSQAPPPPHQSELSAVRPWMTEDPDDHPQEASGGGGGSSKPKASDEDELFWGESGVHRAEPSSPHEGDRSTTTAGPGTQETKSGKKKKKSKKKRGKGDTEATTIHLPEEPSFASEPIPPNKSVEGEREETATTAKASKPETPPLIAPPPIAKSMREIQEEERMLAAKREEEEKFARKHHQEEKEEEGHGGWTTLPTRDRTVKSLRAIQEEERRGKEKEKGRERERAEPVTEPISQPGKASWNIWSAPKSTSARSARSEEQKSMTPVDEKPAPATGLPLSSWITGPSAHVLGEPASVPKRSTAPVVAPKPTRMGPSLEEIMKEELRRKESLEASRGPTTIAERLANTSAGSTPAQRIPAPQNTTVWGGEVPKAVAAPPPSLPRSTVTSSSGEPRKAWSSPPGVAPTKQSKSSSEELFWDFDDKSSKPPPTLPVSTTAPPTISLPPAGHSHKSSKKGSAVEKEPAHSLFGGPEPSSEFIRWCRQQMKGLVGSDDTTLVHFLLSLNALDEMRQYIHTYLGPGPAVSAFADEFVRRVSFEKGDVSRQPQGTWARRAAADTKAAASTGGVSMDTTPAPTTPASDTKGKKKKKGQKVSSALLGFSVSNSSRIMQGEIESPE